MRRRLSKQLDRMREDIRPMQSFVARLRDLNPNDPEVQQALDGLGQARRSLESLMLRAERAGN